MRNVKGYDPNKRGLVDGPGGYWGPHGDRGFGGEGVGTGGMGGAGDNGGNGGNGSNQESPGHPSRGYDPDRSNPVKGDPDKAELSKDLVEKLDPETLRALLEGGHGISGSTYGGLNQSDKNTVNAVVSMMSADQEAQAQKSRMAVMSYLMRSYPPSMHQFDPAYSMQALTPQQQAAFESQGYNLSNLGYVPGEGLMNLAQQPTVRDMTTGEIVGYPSEGLTGYLGMAADFLGLDTSGVNFGVDPEAEREATRGRELTPADPLYYQTLADEATGMPQTVSLEEDITGVMDYAPVYYGVDNWPGAISYAKNGGLASLVPKRRKV